MKNYLIAGLTGQSGAGKTTVSKAFEQQGFAVINCDIIARNVTHPGSICCKELSKLFPACFDEKLCLDRKALASIVFNDKAKLDLLNKTIFPYIISDIEKEIERLVNSGEKYIMLDAPTLFEAGADKLCDVIISCTASKDVRAKRIAQRDNIPVELIMSRFDSQKTEHFFVQHSDFIIENNKDKDSALKQCEAIINEIKRRLNG